MKRLLLAIAFVLVASADSGAQGCYGPGCGAGAVTITSGTTATSGCVAGGVLRSISNMVDCGAGLTFVGGALINTGSSRFGDASLGSTTVPLIARLGTGSTANVFEMQNSAGTVLSSFDSTGRFISPNGTTSLPGVGIGAGAYGWYRSGNAIGLSINTNTFTAFDGVWGGPMLGASAYLVWKDGANAVTATGDVILGRCGAACLQFGLGITSGSAINQTIRSHNATTGTNISGGNLTITAPGGTGSSTGGTIAFQTAPVEASGTTAQTSQTRVTIQKDGGVTFAPILFANLGSPADGTLFFCSDCTIASPCAGSGTGALAKRLNSTWVCN